MTWPAPSCYGEWLRRQRRRGEARDQLRAGYEIFASAGAGAFAERARIELRATGERVPKRTAQTRDTLTAREAHIACLAGQVAGLRAYRVVVPGGVGYHDGYQVAGNDYPRMRMQPNNRMRSVINIFEMKPMSFALGRKLPGPGVFGADSPDSETAVLPCDTRAGAASSTAPRRC